MASFLPSLFLPWLCGFLILRTLEHRLQPERPIHLSRQLGYAFFVGYAGVAAVLYSVDYLAGTLALAPIIAILVVLALSAAAVDRLWKTAPNPPAVVHGPAISNRPGLTLYWLALGLIVLHLALSAVEIYYRPTYAWDAWTTWVYRAKAWYFEGELFQLSTPDDWLTAPVAEPHTMAAYHYPTLPSVIHLWAAIGLGAWSDTWVNAPVLLCGIALALAVYGACRETGLSPAASMIAAYLLLSLPIVGAHIALGGYADIWLAGFTGLGFIALIRGLIGPDRYQLALGTAFLALGCTVKDEGLAWLLLGILLAIITLLSQSRRLRVVLAIIVVAPLALWLLGYQALELPLLGKLGVDDGYLYIPLLSSYQLTSFNVLPIYARSFLERGSWHQLWTLTALALALLPVTRSKRSAAIIAAFYLLFSSAQLLIFGATEKAVFAELNTAINRLLIHFLPVQVFLLALVFWGVVNRTAAARSSDGNNGDHHPLLAWSLAAAFALNIVVTGIYIAVSASTGSGAHPAPGSLTFPPSQFSPAIGGGYIENDRLVINRFDQEMAIASLPVPGIDTAHYPALAYDLAIEGGGTAMFFWRNRDEPGDIHMTLIDPGNHSTLYLGSHPAWGQIITELGIVAYGNEQSSYRLSRLALQEIGDANLAQIIVDDWFTHEPVTLKFINWIDTGRQLQLVTLPGFLAAFLLLLALILVITGMVTKAPRGSLLRVFLTGALIAWLLSDAAWLRNRLVQAVDTYQSYSPGGDPPVNQRASEGFPFEQKSGLVQAAVVDPEAGVIIVGQTERVRFETARLGFTLLPLETLAEHQGIRALPKDWRGYVLVVRDSRRANADVLAELKAHYPGAIDIVLDQEDIILARAGSTGEASP